MSIIGPPTNPKHSLVIICYNCDNFAAQPSVTDQTESPLRLKKLEDVFSVGPNSLNQFIMTIIIQFFETVFTILKW